MPLVDLTSTPLPNDDENADAIDIAGPVNAILAVLNGHIDADNIEPGSMPWSIMDSFTDEIPAAAMEHEGNSVKYRDESNIGGVASGLVWSALTGLNGAMTSGVAYTKNGKRFSVSAIASKTFTANKDTYIDIDTTGAVSYDEQTNGATEPAITDGYIRIAKVVTDASSITSIVSRSHRVMAPSHIGTFAGQGSTGNQSITGVGFKPSRLRIRWFPNNSDGGSAVNMEGIATSPDKQWVTVTATRNTTTARRGSSTQIIRLLSITTGGTISSSGEASLVSFDDDGFTINWTVANSENFIYEAD